MFKKKEGDFRYFNEEWNNEPTTDEDWLEDGVDDYVSIGNKKNIIED